MLKSDETSSSDEQEYEPTPQPNDLSHKHKRTEVAIYFDPDEVGETFPEHELSRKMYCRNFITGSTYEGQWNQLGMDGYGKYTLPHGVVYEGGMRDGEFHGKGKLTYPKGQVISGIFYRGTMITTQFRFKDGHTCVLEDYCKFPDRRFMTTIRTGQFLPPGLERLTDAQPTREIPEGHYDVGDGFYDPKTKWVYEANPLVFDEHGAPIRAPLRLVKPVEVHDYDPEGVPLIKKLPLVPIYQDEKFIVKHCRKAWDEPTGYRPDLFEKWTNGRRKELQEYRAKYALEARKDKESNCLRTLHYMERVVEEEKEKCLQILGQLERAETAV